MKTKNKLILLIILIFAFIFIMMPKSEASGDLKLNDLKFEAKINSDGSMDVIEYWDISISHTNTLYKYFKTDRTRFSGITNVEVTDLSRMIKLTKTDNWAYHVKQDCYYGTNNKQGNFEIGWGVGLDNSRATRKYKIEYTVSDAISKNEDYAELYWQFVGKDFEVSAKKVSGIIYLPSNAKDKSDIKVWGHAEGLNGTIYATGTNKVEFELDGRNEGDMVEVRILFPTEMIISSGRGKKVEILNSVIAEETKWAEQANFRRRVRVVVPTTIVTAIAAFVSILTGFKLKKYFRVLKEFKELGNEKFVPSYKLDYYRDIPRSNAMPGEAYKMINKLLYSIPGTTMGKIISAILLDLSIKKYIEFKVDNTKKDNDKTKVSIIVNTREGNQNELIGEELAVYNFISVIKPMGQEITVKELQNYITRHSSKVMSLVNKINKEVKAELYYNNLVDKDNEKKYTEYGEKIVAFFMLLFFLVFPGVMALAINPITRIAWGVTFAITFVAFIVSIIIKRKINVFTQKGVDETEQWKALKRFMNDYSLLNEKQVPDIALWEKYLVFATAFGISERVIKQLKIAYPNYEEISTINNSTFYIMTHSNFTSSFSNAVSTSISSTYSSSSGGGGGFSGGGGGGGGRRRWRRTLNNIKNE